MSWLRAVVSGPRRERSRVRSPQMQEGVLEGPGAVRTLRERFVEFQERRRELREDWEKRQAAKDAGQWPLRE